MKPRPSDPEAPGCIKVVSDPKGACVHLSGARAVVVRGVFDLETCGRWREGVVGARESWVADFGGEQFCLGRAFYTHLEEEKTRAYFKDAKAANARVEQHVPGLQSAVRTFLADVVSGHVGGRPGFCGAGVHIFPAHGHVARHGGVVHSDMEGLTARHIEERKRAMSLVAMIDPPVQGGGLRLWPRFSTSDEDLGNTLDSSDYVTVRYETGDVILFDSYRVHQIEPFEGDKDRISATLHACEIDAGLWESWF